MLMAIEDKPAVRLVAAHDEAPAIIRDHVFEPKGEWYTLCKHCNLAESAHAETSLQHPVWSIGYVSDEDDD